MQPDQFFIISTWFILIHRRSTHDRCRLKNLRIIWIFGWHRVCDTSDTLSLYLWNVSLRRDRLILVAEKNNNKGSQR
jgi:hypothetical protein